MSSIESKRLPFATRAIAQAVLALLVLAGIFWLISFVWWPEWTGFNPKTLWDVLDLVVVPLALAGGAYWLNKQQKEQELEIAKQHREQELEIAKNQAEELALQSYIDRMSNLLLQHGLRDQAEVCFTEARGIAQAHTNTVLRHLNASRKGLLVQFLHESGLIAKDNPIIDLRHADLKFVILTGADLTGANLAGAILYRAQLVHANLTKASLNSAFLKGAWLIDTDLSGTNLDNTDLSDTDLRAVRYDDDTIWPAGFVAPPNFKGHNDSMSWIGAKSSNGLDTESQSAPKTIP